MSPETYIGYDRLQYLRPRPVVRNTPAVYHFPGSLPLGGTGPVGDLDRPRAGSHRRPCGRAGARLPGPRRVPGAGRHRNPRRLRSTAGHRRPSTSAGYPGFTPCSGPASPRTGRLSRCRPPRESRPTTSPSADPLRDGGGLPASVAARCTSHSVTSTVTVGLAAVLLPAPASRRAARHRRDGTVTLLSGAEWHSKIFSGGWTPAQGGILQTTEPATGEVLAEVGLAGKADVAEAARRARAAQPGWAAKTGPERAALHPAGRSHRRGQPRGVRVLAGPGGWRYPRQGGIRGPARPGRAVGGGGAADAALGSPAAEQRAGAGIASRGGCRSAWSGSSAPWNFPQILSIRAVAPALALGNAVDPQARRAHAGVRRHADRAGCSRRRACRRACCTCCPARPRPASALAERPERGDDRLHRLDRGGPPGGRRGRPDPQAGVAGTRRQQRAHRAR